MSNELQIPSLRVSIYALLDRGVVMRRDNRTVLVGAYQWKAEDTEAGPGRHYLRFAFSAEPLLHDPDRTLDEGIVQAVWMTPAELQDAQARHRSPLVWQVVADYLGGRRSPLSMLQQIA